MRGKGYGLSAALLILSLSHASSVDEPIVFRALRIEKDGVLLQPMLPVMFVVKQTEGDPVLPHDTLDCKPKQIHLAEAQGKEIEILGLECGHRKFEVRGPIFNAQ